MKAIILAGGKGVRLMPYTTSIPKPLVPIENEPILEIILRQLKSYGFRDITVSVGHLAELIKAYLDNASVSKGLDITYVREDKPLGTAGSLSLIKSIKEPFLVMNGDILTTLNYKKLIEFHKRSKGILTIAKYKKTIEVDLGVMDVERDGSLKAYIEKPKKHFDVSMGIYVYEPRALRYIPHGKYFDFPSLVQMLLKSSEKVFTYHFDGYWLDIGRHEDYAKAQQEFAKVKPKLYKG